MWVQNSKVCRSACTVIWASFVPHLETRPRTHFSWCQWEEGQASSTGAGTGMVSSKATCSFRILPHWGTPATLSQFSPETGRVSRRSHFQAPCLFLFSSPPVHTASPIRPDTKSHQAIPLFHHRHLKGEPQFLGYLLPSSVCARVIVT